MLRKAIPQDFDFIYGLHVHPDVNRFLFYKIMSEEEFMPIFNNFLEQDILYLHEENGISLGMCKFSRGQHRCAHIAYLGGVAIHPDFSGRGHAQRMLREVILLGKEKGILRLELGVSTINTKAVYIYEKAGFVKEGFLKKIIYLENEGIYLDDIVMAYFYE